MADGLHHLRPTHGVFAALALALAGTAGAQDVPVPREKPPMLRQDPAVEPAPPVEEPPIEAAPAEAPPAPVEPVPEESPAPVAADPAPVEPAPEPSDASETAMSAMADTDVLRTLLQIQRDNSIWLQVGLFLLALTAMLAAYAAVLAHRAARASLRSDRNSRAALLAETRPWLKVELVPYGPLMWTEEGCHVAVMLSVENIGRAPALDVWAKMDGMTGTGADLAGALDATTRGALSETHAPGVIIYPGERFSEQQAVLLPRSRQGRPAEGEIFGCVTYRMQGGVRGQTGFSYAVLPQATPGAANADNGADFSIRARPELALIN